MPRHILPWLKVCSTGIIAYTSYRLVRGAANSPLERGSTGLAGHAGSVLLTVFGCSSECREDCSMPTALGAVMPTPLKWLFNFFDFLVVIGMAVMSVLIFTNVVLRYGFSSGISTSVEISRVILVWVIFLGAVVGLVKGAHLSVDAVVARLPQRARFACFLVSYSLMLWCCWLLAQGSWALTRIEWGNITPLTGLPVGLT